VVPAEYSVAAEMIYCLGGGCRSGAIRQAAASNRLMSCSLSA